MNNNCSTKDDNLPNYSRLVIELWNFAIIVVKNCPIFVSQTLEFISHKHKPSEYVHE